MSRPPGLSLPPASATSAASAANARRPWNARPLRGASCCGRHAACEWTPCCARCHAAARSSAATPGIRGMAGRACWREQVTECQKTRLAEALPAQIRLGAAGSLGWCQSCVKAIVLVRGSRVPVTRVVLLSIPVGKTAATSAVGSWRGRAPIRCWILVQTGAESGQGAGLHVASAGTRASVGLASCDRSGRTAAVSCAAPHGSSVGSARPLRHPTVERITAQRERRAGVPGGSAPRQQLASRVSLRRAPGPHTLPPPPRRASTL